MRASDFIKEEEKLDEILPLIGLAARGAMGLAGGAARLAGRAALKGAGAVARGVGSAVGKTARAATNMLGSDDDEETNDPNAAVGTQGAPKSAGATKFTRSPQTAQTAQTTTGRASATNAPDFRPGARVNMPTNTGRMGNFKVTKVIGNEVEIENPDRFKVPGEPEKLTFTKDELAKMMGAQR